MKSMEDYQCVLFKWCFASMRHNARSKIEIERRKKNHFRCEHEIDISPTKRSNPTPESSEFGIFI